MKIITSDSVNHVTKPEGTEVSYYLFKDYELHYNEQAPNTTQTWHHHEKSWETLYIIEGELNAEWKEDDLTKSQVVKAGDLIETEHTPHTFSNKSGKIVKFIVIKRIQSSEDYSEVFKSDKVLD
jgi:uncharacterized cupin superfamily protein